MSNVFMIILIAVGYGLWKVLDHFQLPNTFSILLIIFTALSGAVWCYLRFGVLPKRARQIARLEQRSGKPLNDEEKTQIEPISESSEFVASLFPVLAFVLIVRSFIFEPFQIPSSSMEPTLRIGDFILVNKFDYGIKDPVFQNTLIKRGEPQRGDVIVFKAPESPSTDYIKRVVGTPGDCETKEFSYTLPQPNENFRFILGRDHSGKVQYGPAPLETIETGDVTHAIHWYPQPINEGYRYKAFSKQENYVTEWVVPEGQYFVMGDNRNNSEDSRFWGFVPSQNIVGKATYIWLSLKKEQDEWPTGIRTERLFQKIQ